MNKLDSTSSRPWQLIIPAASALLVALIGFGGAMYQTDKPIQLTAVALTAQAVSQTASATPAAAVAQATPTTPAPAQAGLPQAETPVDAPPDSAAAGSSIIVTNRLVLPVKIFINGAFKLELEPGGLEALPLENSPSDLRWSVVRLSSANGLPLGGAVGGTQRGVKAGDEVAIVNLDGEQSFFYPIVSNTSNKDCKVTIDEGWTSEETTGIVIPARQENVSLGYYPLYSYSNVTLECGGQFYWWGLRPNEHNRAPIYYEVEKETGVIRFTMH